MTSLAAKKPRAKLLAKMRLLSSEKPYYVEVRLWASFADLHRGAGCDVSSAALCETLLNQRRKNGPYSMPIHMSTLHFASGQWDINYVAHEVQHAIFHRLRYLNPGPGKVLPEHHPDFNPLDEEVLAYESGAWVEETLTWLTQTDKKSPYRKDTFSALN